ncbi:Cytochrome P450 CYP4/CYP19/CYP26 subfamily [Handroanthus impetiginosus]|uniref:Cytochrome P450 CYP4/CYP19/CYP26 subfamily n=1 Tax=Handroanthus impetiginosus TaxID=429701 RepID=A0A2G9GDA0_9LAMI|nr:Cytochrome P450 CYP4/CYP19/CYP26 subfamily [Handroanthus impetiginosus]
MWKFAIIPLLSILALWTWQFFNWVWLKPRKTEKFFRNQGMKGNSYRFLLGDSKETSRMYEKAYSKPIGLNDDIVPRVMPNIVDTIKKYGNYSFTWLGPRPRVFVLDPDIIKEVLGNYRKFTKPFNTSNPIVKMLVTGLINMEGDEWAKSRSKLNPTFYLDNLKPMVPAIKVCCENTIEAWREKTSKGGGSSVVDAYPYLEVFTGSVLAQLMFSSAYTEQIKTTFLQLSELALLGRLSTHIFPIPGERYFPTQKNRRAKEIDKFVRVTFTSMINERLEKRKSGSDSCKLDLLDMFMEELYWTKDRDRERIIEDVIGQCKIFFFAGYETSSNLLCWTMVMLSLHQDWQIRAREEVLQVLCNKKEITFDDLSKLKIVTMILNEMLRLYPPTMEFSRVVGEETKIGKYIIPKDTMVTCPILILHRSTEIWGKDAGEFRPERFAEGVAKAAKSEAAYMPFGWGPRICIAQNFGILETKTFLAILLRNFSFEISPSYAHAPFVDVTLRPQYGAPLVLREL